MATTETPDTDASAGYARGYTEDEFSPIRHCRGAHLSWKKIDLLLRATEAYGRSLVVASKAGIDVTAERRENDQFHSWLWGLRKTHEERAERSTD